MKLQIVKLRKILLLLLSGGMSFLLAKWWTNLLCGYVDGQPGRLPLQFQPALHLTAGFTQRSCADFWHQPGRFGLRPERAWRKQAEARVQPAQQ